MKLENFYKIQCKPTGCDHNYQGKDVEEERLKGHGVFFIAIFPANVNFF
jgi:hypothetical protein